MKVACDALAIELHCSQYDLVGEPYWQHLRRVAEMVQDSGGTRTQIDAAWLHDSLEDTDATLRSLRESGIPVDVIDLVAVLTHFSNEPYTLYIDRVKACPDAVIIKLADLYDNLNPVRMSKVEPAKRQRLLKKYGNAIAQLAG